MLSVCVCHLVHLFIMFFQVEYQVNRIKALNPKILVLFTWTTPTVEIQWIIM